MKRLSAISSCCWLLSLLVMAFGAYAEPSRRIVSLDYCADQFVLKLLPRDRILAISPDGTKPFSYMRETAKGMPTVRPLAEDVLILEPDLIVRSYGGGPNAAAFFKRANFKVLQLAYANKIDDIKTSILTVAKALNVEQKGLEVVAEMNRRLKKVRDAAKHRRPATILYVTPSGVTAGPGTLIDEMIHAAGMGNFQTLPGWRSLPLERLAYEQPDMIATAFYEAKTNHFDAWSPSRHPLVIKQFTNLPLVSLQGSITACGGWFILDGIEAISRQHQQVSLNDG